MDETHADAGTPRPLTLESMQASRDCWQQKAIDRKERLDIILAAARAVVRYHRREDVDSPFLVDAEWFNALNAAVEAAGQEGE
jgi:hypothetical protein